MWARTLGLALAIVAVACAPARGQMTVRPGTTGVVFGDSITAGLGSGGPWFIPWANAVNVAYTGVSTNAHSGAVTTKAGTRTSSATLGPITAINKGVSGNKLSDLIARVGTDVVALAPQWVIIEECINDWVANTDHATYQSEAASLLMTIQTDLPGVPIAWVSCLSFGEYYPDPNATTIAAYDSDIQAAITARGGTYVDVRTPQQTYESINNVPPPGVAYGILCSDLAGAHPNPDGVTLMSNKMLNVTITTPL